MLTTVSTAVPSNAQPPVLKPGTADISGGQKNESESDEERFNETLKRMLKTPPKPHTPEHKQKSNSDSQKRKRPPQGDCK